METMALPCLPDELIVQILSRLPVKSLIRFKCVYAAYYYGFGYDQLTDDYLVVSFSYVLNFDDDHVNSRLEFFSLRDSMWKELEGTPFPYMLYPDEHRVGSLFSGAIHWLAFHNDLARDVIIAFDLMERRLLEMPFPDGFGLESEYSHLWVFGQFLSLTGMDHDNSRVEIWVMKEYKVHSSWTKTLNLSIDGIPYFSPICSTKSGDIIGTNGETELLKYNDKGQLLEHNSFWDGPCPIGSLVTMYTESLLSLPSDNVLP
ncbi:putative F-box domain-containing protein [Medicago truncatula]|uniref:F-box protein interaction domain protein n=1 Tax=Medicago truncatula TaxID=3880 RepID=G7JGN0_MEDTR|nr:F-box protein interaction domain protein [Medicago truncatula]RHN64060.1 putative F-box domain-containing protein [Medicago truncatula]